MTLRVVERKSDNEAEFLRAFGARVREGRMKVGLTQTELGKKLGLTRSSIANIEAGRQATAAYTLVRIVRLLGLHDVAALGAEPGVEAELRGELARRLDELAHMSAAVARARGALADAFQAPASVAVPGPVG